MHLVDLNKDELYYLIDQYIHSERDRAIMKRKLHDGITYERLAEEFDLSVGQTKNIVYKGKDRLVTVLERMEDGCKQSCLRQSNLDGYFG